MYRMSISNKVLYCCLLATSLSTLPINKANATCTQSFHYHSEKLNVTFVANYGSEEREKRFLQDIKKVLPSILGLAKVIKQNDDPTDIFVGCQQNNEAILEIGKEETIKIKCDESSFGEAIASLAEKMKKPISAILEFKGYTLQVAYIGKGVNPFQEKERWLKKLASADYDPTMNIIGDCTQVPIWIHRYPDDSFGIRFGIFNSYENAKKAIKVLNLGGNHSQILSLEINVDELDKFFDWAKP